MPMFRVSECAFLRQPIDWIQLTWAIITTAVENKIDWAIDVHIFFFCLLKGFLAKWQFLRAQLRYGCTMFPMVASKPIEFYVSHKSKIVNADSLPLYLSHLLHISLEMTAFLFISYQKSIEQIINTFERLHLELSWQ